MLRAFDISSGKVRWQYDVRQDGRQFAFHGDPIITDGLVVITCDNSWNREGAGHVYAFDQRTGKVRWKHREQTGIPSNLARLGTTVFAVTLADELIAIDLGSGRLRWRFAGSTADEEPDISASPAAAGKHAYFGTRDGNVCALDARSGEVVWKHGLGDRIATNLIVDGADLYAGTPQGRLFRLDRHTGIVTGETNLSARPCSAPALLANAVLVQSGEQSLVCLDRSLTTVRWKYKAPERCTSKGPAVHNGSVLIGTATGKIIALAIEDGTVRGTRKLEGEIRCIGSIGDVLYAGTRAGMLYVWRVTD